PVVADGLAEEFSSAQHSTPGPTARFRAALLWLTIQMRQARPRSFGTMLQWQTQFQSKRLDALALLKHNLYKGLQSSCVQVQTQLIPACAHNLTNHARFLGFNSSMHAQETDVQIMTPLRPLGKAACFFAALPVVVLTTSLAGVD